MAAPSPTPRTLPTGFKMPDGFKAVVTFGSIPAINLFERDVKPPGIDGGDPIDTTTMHNIAWRTRFPRQLKTLDPVSFNAGYDPDVITDIMNLVNRNDTITVRWMDGSTLAFYGTLQKWEPSDLKEGDFPLAACTVVATNWDSNANVEAGPVFTAASGT